LLLVLIPWSAFWERNYFVDWSPALVAVLTSNYTRGAVTGLGLLNVWAALAELGDALGSRRPPDHFDTQSEAPSHSEANPRSDIRNQQW
jgi:hypothetical protein